MADPVDDNPYLREFRRLETELSGARDYVNLVHGASGMSAYDRRVWCVRRCAFAVQTEEALATLARYAPIVELGAGTGYWAFLLRHRGVDIVAFDIAPPGQFPNAYKFEPRTWTAVLQGGVEVLDQYPDHTLFLCWPGYKDTFAD